ncbi:unnamed protein product, partial [Rotaria sp. Silwood1]
AFFRDERSKLIQQKHESQMKWISKEHNIWKFARPAFHAFSPPFRGLMSNSEIIKDPKVIVELLGDYYEHHFMEPKPDENNPMHQ